MLMTVYFPYQKSESLQCVGAIGLLEKDKSGLQIWRVYKICPVTKTSVLFQRNNHEFVVTNGEYTHEMGEIKISTTNGFLNVCVTVKEDLLKEYGIALLEKERQPE